MFYHPWEVRAITPTDLARALRLYLTQYLPGPRNLRPHTIPSYRNTFKLLLRYCHEVRGMAIEHLTLTDFDAVLIRAFLNWLETEPHNTISTRNQRLARLHAFYRDLPGAGPAGLLSCQKVLAILQKKTAPPIVQHLTPEVLKLVLAQPDRPRRRGRRDATLLATL